MRNNSLLPFNLFMFSFALTRRKTGLHFGKGEFIFIFNGAGYAEKKEKPPSPKGKRQRLHPTESRIMIHMDQTDT